MIAKGAGLLLVLAVGVAHAEPVTLRLAAVTPDGTPWARELRAFARDVESSTKGQVRVKWYLGGIAGDEMAALARLRHGQLDGIAGASFCEQVAPSLRVLSVVGLFQTRDEVAFILNQLKPQLDKEYEQADVTDLLNTIFGSDILFSRRPVGSMADFRALRWWVWKDAPIYQVTFPKLGLRTVPAALDQAAADFQANKTDGFVALPSAALAFQWSTMAAYFTVLNVAIVPGCMVLARGAMDPLRVDQQQAIRAAAARLMVHWNDTTATLDQALVDRLFEKQGLKRVPVSPQFRTEFFEAARAARDQLPESLVSHALLTRVLSLLADYRLDRGGSPHASVPQRISPQ